VIVGPSQAILEGLVDSLGFGWDEVLLNEKETNYEKKNEVHNYSQ